MRDTLMGYPFDTSQKAVDERPGTCVPEITRDRIE